MAVGFVVGPVSGRNRRSAVCCRVDGREGVVIGLNQYSHDASVALVDAKTGELLFAASKERLTRKKHDGGETNELVLHALQGANVDEEDVALIVANNHHFRIRPFEDRLPFSVRMGYYPVEYLHDRLRGKTPKREVSHHLAHAWSVLPFCPFSHGLIVVMDGMGDHIREFGHDDADFSTDETLPQHPSFQEFPRTKLPRQGYREAESAFLFDGTQLTRVYKRWTRENSPPELYNHGFENMESLGALYSRVSSHIFGDWNSCGKVMGLAPWAGQYPRAGKFQPPLSTALLHGDLFDGSATVDFGALAALPLANEWDESSTETMSFYAHLADRVQTDVQVATLRFLHQLREKTGARNLCLVGGVALNSTINGMVVREAGFDQVYIPPYPGDEGIAIGCASFGAATLGGKAYARPARSTAYLGVAYTDADIEDALEEGDLLRYLDVKDFHGRDGASSAEDRMAAATREAAKALADGEVVAWFQGRSEFGPRALGNRSLLADPRQGGIVDHLNVKIKKRERFRPFAPSVLADRAEEFFELKGVENVSPYMTITAKVRDHAQELIPGVCHIDSTARLQTVRQEDNPLYHALIREFHERTGVPVVLNTSFNVAGQPIVETPTDAISTFLDAPIDVLVLHDRVIRKKPAQQLHLTAENRVQPVMEAVPDFGFSIVHRESFYDDVHEIRLGCSNGREIHLESPLDLELLRHVHALNEYEADAPITVNELRAWADAMDYTADTLDSSIQRLVRHRLLFLAP